jgi:hypothetical protein
MATGSYDATYVLSRTSLRRARLQWLWDTQGLMLVGVAVILVMAVYLLATIEDGKPIFAFIAGALFCFLSMYLWSGLAGRGIPHLGQMSIRLNDEGIALSYDQGESLTRWPALRKIILTKDYLFLARRGGGPLLIPRTALSAEGLAILRANVAGERQTP